MNVASVAGLGSFALKFRLDNNQLRHCYVGAIRESNHSRELYLISDLLQQKDNNGQIVVGNLRTIVTPALLFKEFPDEFGSDFISIFEVRNRSYRTINIKWIVVRIQVKLGISTTSVDKDGKSPIDWMKQHEDIILKSLKEEKRNVLFIRVLWTSRPTKEVSKDNDVVLRGPDMPWLPKVKAFVNEHKIRPYGYKADFWREAAAEFSGCSGGCYL